MKSDPPKAAEKPEKQGKNDKKKPHPQEQKHAAKKQNAPQVKTKATKAKHAVVPSKVSKVLCLHGFLQDAALFRGRMSGNVEKVLKQAKFECVYLQSPLVAKLEMCAQDRSL